MSEYFEGINKGPITGNPPRELLWVNAQITDQEVVEQHLAIEAGNDPSEENMQELSLAQARLDYLYHRLGVHAGLRDWPVVDAEPKFGKTS